MKPNFLLQFFRVDKLLVDAHVQLQGKTKKLTGNHGRILLEKLLNGTVDYDGPGHKLLMLLADIQQFCVAAILPDEVIDDFKESMDNFIEEFSKPEYDSIAKSSEHIHVLISHVIPFVELHRTWGLHSDQRMS